ncbi:type IV secretion system protein [Desulfotomaculum copahuensis]|uniref:TrbL/VirB6 plasmid conjugal transfer protein n=1 Tax=Desulfotomaculum copahuensis TaxID=1838280 RepID=A0A1B7LG48_9FIRM|nr:type IV secretion system protein [Desulfotomaculum copahuensis]OAT83703.1 hypothetical protein A6M21_07655 [Desulfotomaculum copahuensis]
MIKKTITIILISVICFSFALPAFAMIGGADAGEYNLAGDIDAEKAQEGLLFELISIGTAGSAGLVAGGPFGALVASTGAAGLAQIYKNATWENWPMDRWTFDHAPVEGGWDLSKMAQNGVYQVEDFVANLLFSATKMLTRVSINICVLAFHTDIVSGMVGWVSDGIKNIFTPNGDLTQLLMSWGIIFLLVYAVFWFIRREITSIISALLVAAVAVGGMFFFATNAQPLISSFARATDSVTGVFLGAVGGYLGNSISGQNVNADPMDKGLIVAGQAAWNAIVAEPWAAAMFGTTQEDNLKLTADEYNLLAGHKDEFPDPAKLQSMTIDNIYLATTGPARNTVVDVLSRPTPPQNHLQKGLDSLTGNQPAPVDHGNHPGTTVGMAAGSTLNHIVVAALTLIPAIAFAFLAVSIGLSILVCQIMLAAMLLVLPVFLFALIWPVHGWNLTARYFKHLASFFMVKLVYGLYLSLVLSIGTAFTLAIMK